MSLKIEVNDNLFSHFAFKIAKISFATLRFEGNVIPVPR